MKKIVSVLLIMSFVLGIFCSCSKKADSDVLSTTLTEYLTAAVTEGQTQESTTSVTETQIEELTTAVQESTTQQPTTAQTTLLESNSNDVLNNSFSMLYYLSITAEKIRSSKNNRVVLQKIREDLNNVLNPGAINDRTQEYIDNLKHTIEEFYNLSIKRERLQYLYNQKKANAIREAVPNPLAILSLTNSFNWKKLAVSAVYTIVDSYTSYKKSGESADQEFLMSGWELDDKERETFEKNRDIAYNYLIDTVQDFPEDQRLSLGKKTPNEKAITDFVEICNLESIPEKIQRLKQEENRYSLLGSYWLELANCYFEISKYKECLDCIEEYNNLLINIYREDYNYAQILPKAIVAAQTVYKNDNKKYISVIKDFTDSILENTASEKKENWSLRYFAAQSYLDLYSKTNNKKYIESAYKIAKENATNLLEGQRDINNKYLSAYKDVTIEEPDYRFMSEKEKEKAEKEYKEDLKRLKEYNKQQKKLRETELPELYEPLILNCDLLFALADKLNIKDSEKKEIEDLLKDIFISKPVNNCYSFFKKDKKNTIEFSRDAIRIPANLLLSDAKFVVAIKEKGKAPVIITDFVVEKVERNGNKIDDFVAIVSSKTLKKYDDWSNNKTVTLKITNGYSTKPILTDFIVSEYKHYPVLPDKVVFKQK
ncbi:MAG: hypothetical protein J5562_03195 [Clostridia bacterium]|nr:hypothetical protein [Clostridia bacterium]